MEIQKALDELKSLKVDYNLDLGIDFEKAQAEINQALQLQQTGVMRCSSKDIDKFYNDTMYTDQTNYYGVIQRTKKGDYVRWKQPSQMIKDFMRWKKNNA